MLNFRKSLLKWLFHGTPQDLWSIGCLNASIVDCDPIPLKYINILGGPWWASLLETIDELSISKKLISHMTLILYRYIHKYNLT